jgi:hypothetical protein
LLLARGYRVKADDYSQPPKDQKGYQKGIHSTPLLCPSLCGWLGLRHDGRGQFGPNFAPVVGAQVFSGCRTSCCEFYRRAFFSRNFSLSVAPKANSLRGNSQRSRKVCYPTHLRNCVLYRIHTDNSTLVEVIFLHVYLLFYLHLYRL